MLDSKEKSLQDFIQLFKTVMVAYSGGLDSSLLLFMTLKTLGPERTWGVTSVSASLAADEKDAADKIAVEIGLPAERHILIKTNEMSDPRYVSNNPDRCYFCKTELFSHLRKLAVDKNVDVIFDGTNLSDLSDYRPGRAAANEKKIVSPFVETGFTKEDVRVLARKYGLTFSEKPATPCLASRIPYGTEVTIERLRQIEAAELALRELGFKGFRVRYHHDVARLELSQNDILRIFENGVRQKIIDAIKNAGFRYASIDLEGYRQGSLNEGLGKKEQ